MKIRRQIRLLTGILFVCITSLLGAYGIEAFADTGTVTSSMDGVVVFLKNNWGVYNEQLETFDYQAPDIIVKDVQIVKSKMQGNDKAYVQTSYVLGEEKDAEVTMLSMPGVAKRENELTGEKEEYLNWTAGKQVTLRFTINGVDGITEKNILVSVDPTQTDSYKSLEDVNNFSDLYVPLDHIKVDKNGSSATITVSYTPVIQLAEKDILAGKVPETQEQKKYWKIADQDAYVYYKEQQELASLGQTSKDSGNYPSVTGGKWRYYAQGGKYQLADASGNYLEGSYYSTPGWVLADGLWYYIGADGYSVRGTQVIDGISYQFDEYGRLQE